MDFFEGVYLTNKERAERNLSLPDSLDIFEIAELWTCDKREQEIYRDAMYQAFKRGRLPGKEYKDDPYWDDVPVISPYQIYIDVTISRPDFFAWLQSVNMVLPKDCLILKWHLKIDGSETKQSCEGLINERRNKDFERWIEEEKPDINKMKWPEIQSALRERDENLWGKGFRDWKKQQSIIKKPGGRPRGAMGRIYSKGR